jgi:hypothetical protein
VYYNREWHDFCQQSRKTPGIGRGTAHRTVLWSPGTPATTTHGSANLWDTEEKVKLQTAGKTKLLLNTVAIRMAVSHTVIIANSIIHESY